MLLDETVTVLCNQWKSVQSVLQTTTAISDSTYQPRRRVSATSIILDSSSVISFAMLMGFKSLSR